MDGWGICTLAIALLLAGAVLLHVKLLGARPIAAWSPDCAEAHGARPAVAIYLVGLKRRLLLNSTLELAVLPLREAFGVHFYASLVDNSSGIGNFLPVRSHGVVDPAIAHLFGEDLRRNIRDRIRAVGACLMCLELQTTPEPLPAMPHQDDIMYEYLPYRAEAGARVLRVWLARERLWNLTLANEVSLGLEYRFLMWVRDDTHWGMRWRPAKLFASWRAGVTVWTSDCGAWGGINDKTVVFGRRAAPAMLTLFTTYMSGIIRGPIWNAERFLWAAAEKFNLRLHPCTFTDFPVVPAMLVDLGSKNSSNMALCFVKFYWCYGDLLKFNLTGEFCEVFDDR